MAVCLDNLLHVSNGAKSLDPETQLSHSNENIKKLSSVAGEALYQLWQAGLTHSS